MIEVSVERGGRDLGAATAVVWHVFSSGRCFPSMKSVLSLAVLARLGRSRRPEMVGVPFHVIGFVWGGAGAIWAQPLLMSGRCPPALPWNRSCAKQSWRDVGAAAAYE